jgi:hypothetical protein
MQAEMEELRKAKRGTGMKRVRRNEKTKEEAQLTLSGKKYALTTRLWLPDIELECDEESNAPKQILLKEYINALPSREQGEYQAVAVVRMVRSDFWIPFSLNRKLY